MIAKPFVGSKHERGQGKPCPPGLEPNTTYSESALRAAILPEAQKQLEGPGESEPERTPR